MATYQQLTLFDLKPYSSECNISDTDKTFQVEDSSKQIEYDQLELNLFPKPPPILRLSVENSIRAA
jgi:hypothetical protein